MSNYQKEYYKKNKIRILAYQKAYRRFRKKILELKDEVTLEHIKFLLIYFAGKAESKLVQEYLQEASLKVDKALRKLKGMTKWQKARKGYYRVPKNR